MAEAVDSLKKDFWSDSNREAQVAKRKLVIELAQAVGGEWWTPPLTERVVLGVAASLKAAGVKTAASLVNELKLLACGARPLGVGQLGQAPLAGKEVCVKEPGSGEESLGSKKSRRWTDPRGNAAGIRGVTSPF